MRIVSVVVVVFLFLLGCTVEKTNEGELYLNVRQKIDQIISGKQKGKEREKILEAISELEEIVKRYPEKPISLKILEVSSEPYSINGLQYILMSFPETPLLQPPSFSANVSSEKIQLPVPPCNLISSFPMEFSNNLAGWINENSMRLPAYEDFVIADQEILLCNYKNISATEAKELASNEKKSAERIQRSLVGNYDFAIIRTPACWKKQGIIFETVNKDIKFEEEKKDVLRENMPFKYQDTGKNFYLWYTDLDSIRPERVGVSTKSPGILNYQASYPFIIENSFAFECSDGIYNVSEVEDLIKTVELEAFDRYRDTEFAFGEDDCEVKISNATWTEVHRLIPNSVTGQKDFFIITIPSEEFKRVGFSHGDSVNVRAEGSKASKVLFQLKTGQKVKILETTPEWTKIKVNDVMGWVFSQFLKNVPPVREKSSDYREKVRLVNRLLSQIVVLNELGRKFLKEATVAYLQNGISKETFEMIVSKERESALKLEQIANNRKKYEQELLEISKPALEKMTNEYQRMIDQLKSQL